MSLESNFVDDAQPTPHKVALHLAIEERRIQSLKLLCEGWTYAEIGEKFGVSTATISKDIRILNERHQQDAAQDVDSLKFLRMSRINELMKVYFPRALEGSFAAFDRVMKLEEQFDKLTGLDKHLAAQGEKQGQDGDFGPQLYMPENNRDTPSVTVIEELPVLETGLVRLPYAARVDAPDPRYTSDGDD